MSNYLDQPIDYRFCNHLGDNNIFGWQLTVDG